MYLKCHNTADTSRPIQPRHVSAGVHTGSENTSQAFLVSHPYPICNYHVYIDSAFSLEYRTISDRLCEQGLWPQRQSYFLSLVQFLCKGKNYMGVMTFPLIYYNVQRRIHQKNGHINSFNRLASLEEMGEPTSLVEMGEPADIRVQQIKLD
ncbi:uncharacterized protein ACNLHF_015310 [Anomaloglossus baeobatrachus]